MKHRHLNGNSFSLAAIDDVISRGKWRDWAELRKAVLEDPCIMEKVKRICSHYISDPYAQRYHFWMNYVKAHTASASEQELPLEPQRGEIT